MEHNSSAGTEMWTPTTLLHVFLEPCNPEPSRSDVAWGPTADLRSPAHAHAYRAPISRVVRRSAAFVCE